MFVNARICVYLDGRNAPYQKSMGNATASFFKEAKELDEPVEYDDEPEEGLTNLQTPVPLYDLNDVVKLVTSTS